MNARSWPKLSWLTVFKPFRGRKENIKIHRDEDLTRGHRSGCAHAERKRRVGSGF